MARRGEGSAWLCRPQSTRRPVGGGGSTYVLGLGQCVLDLLASVFDLLAGVLEAGLRLVGLAFVLGALVAADPARCLLGLTADVLDLVLRLVDTTHVLTPHLVSGHS